MKFQNPQCLAVYAGLVGYEHALEQPTAYQAQHRVDVRGETKLRLRFADAPGATGAVVSASAARGNVFVVALPMRVRMSNAQQEEAMPSKRKN